MDQSMRLESLERTLQEIEALEAIFDDSFALRSPEAVRLAARRTVTAGAAVTNDNEWTAPRLEVELRVALDGVDEAPAAVRLRCGLPPGYPAEAAAEAFVAPALAADGLPLLRRAAREDLSARLTQKARELVGSEAVLELVQELQDAAPAVVAAHQDQHGCKGKSGEGSSEPLSESLPSDFGLKRCWIWVHHIKDAGRRKDIVKESRGLALGGYLKPGYPGIVVVEGEAAKCDEFVTWIKGSKSRPGGFGRNWGHHVRGDISVPNDVRLLPETFEELEGDMAALGAACKDRGLENEFLEYVMQHKPS